MTCLQFQILSSTSPAALPFLPQTNRSQTTPSVRKLAMDLKTPPSYGNNAEHPPPIDEDDGNSPEPTAGQKRKRIRASRACETCRARKVKCNEQNPCSNCVRQQIQCRYAGGILADQGTIEAMARRLADLESLILATQVRERPSHPSLPIKLNTDSTSPETKPYIAENNAPRNLPSDRITGDDSTESEAPSPPGADHSLIDVNNETHGVEYYGGSSSVAILDRLYKRARRQSTNYQTRSNASNKPSVVNLLHNPEFHELSPQAVHNSPDGVYHGGDPVSSRLIEGGFLNAFFDTLHYMHPVIDKAAFLEQCDKGAVEAENDFAALYYTCLALAAITSPEKDPKLTGFLPIQWANMYVDRAKKALGDIFSVTTVKTVQALLLLATVAQNALRPHDCYMYLGAALRSAQAIGMHEESPRVRDQRARRRTWWAIYSIEAELCCASGRLNSLPTEEDMTILLPNMEEEVPEVSMINVMVCFAQIAREVSSRIYIGRKTLAEKAEAALDLDARLVEWRETLPGYLHKDRNSLRQPDFVNKQKIVLELRFYHLRLLIHQPFLAATEETEKYRYHVDQCVSAASATIHHLHETFLHRHYFRSWWYNSTYALFASMILLHHILKNPKSENIQKTSQDIELSIEVFTAMGHHRVAKRCLELVSEVFELAKKAIQDQESGPTLQNNLPVEDGSEFFASLIDPFLLEDFAFNDAKLDGLTPGLWNAPDPSIGGDGPNALEMFLNFSANR